ncbi:MAG: protein translocase subunit SecD, partial [Chloroflexi bacterium]|nr:protein translocase subunit SecD [Chloroflexota bacterium]
MTTSNQRILILIFFIVAISIWIVIPNNPGIHIFGIEKDIKTRLGLDLVGGVQALLEADLPSTTNITAEDMDTAIKIVENRVNGLGLNEAVVQKAGERRIVVELPGETDPEKALKTIKTTGLLEFVDFSDIDNSTAISMLNTKIQTDYEQSVQAEGTITPTVASSETITNTDVVTTSTAASSTVFHTVMTGKYLKTVQVSTDPQTNQIEIGFELTSDGAKIFADHTSTHIGKVLAIVLDKEIISVPSIETAITEGTGRITGSYTLEEANALAVQLRYGSLPIPLKVIESKTVGPTLGQDSLTKSMRAGIIGFIIVMLFMGIYYRVPGLIANLAIIVYALIAFASYKFIPITLTLPGIAGFLLSTGSALDANILIFERLKEELRAGKRLDMAISLGWKRAW